MITWKRKFVTVGEVWFDEPYEPLSSDVIVCYHWSVPAHPLLTKPFFSIEIDLSKDLDALLGAAKKDMRQKLTRAEKDGLDFEGWTDVPTQIFQEFCDFYDGFAAQRGLTPAQRHWMDVYRKAGRLAISRVTRDGVPLVWHSYYRDLTHVRQLQSASFYREVQDPALRSVIGRANRLHHWKDIQWFKENRIRLFDMGGWYEGAEDEGKLRINQFKEEFGGVITKRFYSMLPVGLRGRAFLLGRRMRRTGGDEFIHMV